MIVAKGLKYQLKTELNKNRSQRTAPIVLLDTIGELQAVYSIASVVFCGGSLVPLGGHNVLEPAVWGKPVLYGPSMEDFADARTLLENKGGGIPIKDGEELADKVIYFLGHPNEARKVGDKARKAVLANRGAAKKHAREICRILEC
jgi:3-deoxy-D-manno-octulosonic-acid transferase